MYKAKEELDGYEINGKKKLNFISRRMALEAQADHEADPDHEVDHDRTDHDQEDPEEEVTVDQTPVHDLDEHNSPCNYSSYSQKSDQLVLLST